MEAKEILKALSKAGMIEKGEICMGKNIRNVLQTIEIGIYCTVCGGLYKIRKQGLHLRN